MEEGQDGGRKESTTREEDGPKPLRIAISSNFRQACGRFGYWRVQKVYSQDISSAVIPEDLCRALDRRRRTFGPHRSEIRCPLSSAGGGPARWESRAVQVLQ